jgi:eukaryotic-like serine/threonine-protein kinase
MLQQGDRIAEWIVDALLGEGAMGAVYRVHSALSWRVDAALKVMKPSGEGDARALFVREAETLCTLRHPAIVQVMGFSEDPERGLLCLVMELAEGETLRQRFAGGAMGLPEALPIFVPLASALDHAHDHGVFHRDLKPANVVLCADGPRLVDFGIAALALDPVLDTDVPMGTLAYLPPEVFRRQRAGPAAMDVYAFGLLLYEALTGSRGFSARPGQTPDEVEHDIAERKRQQGPFDPGERFPHRLREVVRSATDPDPARRPAMGFVRSSLEALQERRGLQGVGVTHAGAHRPPAAHVPDDPTTYVRDAPETKARRQVGIAALAALAAAIALGAIGWRSHAGFVPVPDGGSLRDQPR